MSNWNGVGSDDEKVAVMQVTAFVRRLGSLEHQDEVEQLKANAVRCRALSESASDPEVSEALLQIAADIDAAIEVLQDNVAVDQEKKLQTS